MKNTSAPINRIPPEVLSLIPDYWKHQLAEKDVIALTHVCHGWREIFTSRPSLWTRLDCRNVDKTRIYIERSKTLPLNITLRESRDTSLFNRALSVAIPFLSRSNSITISVLSPKTLMNLLDSLPFSAPLLKEVEIFLHGHHSGRHAVIPSTIFPQHPSPLRKLCLSGVITHLPWRNLSNLSVFEFSHTCESPGSEPSVITELLGFFESAPLLRRIALRNLNLRSFAIPSGRRVVRLPNLEKFTANPFSAYSTFFDHLSIPTGASVDLYLFFSEGGSLTPFCFAKNFKDLHITTINLFAQPSCRKGGYMGLDGPSGRLRAYGRWAHWGYEKESAFFGSLCEFDLSNVQRLSAAAWILGSEDKIEASPIFKPLLSMNNLRTLILIRADNTPFIYALNPAKNTPNVILCPALEDLVLYAGKWSMFSIQGLEEMVSERAKRFSKFWSITIISQGEAFYPVEAVLSLRKHVSRVEYKLEVSSPGLDTIFGDNIGDEDDDDRDRFLRELEDW